MPIIKVILGSTRPNRFGIQIADWVMDLAKEHPEATYELIDLSEVNLPFLDEPLPPVMNQYANEHTKNWAKTIDGGDGFVFVTAEYNHGIPAALKNAIDFLAKEWRYKPASFVSYGADLGGGRAVEQLRGVAGNLDMFALRDQVSIVNYFGQLDEAGHFKPHQEQADSLHKLLDRTAFWAAEMRQSRERLGK